ncbi:TM2 domain-containing protein [Biomphalaria pfeifferi]|uniref:TM2 domain-containing protein n=1 Tax=Biomphalaria pfeifferi TaxID=112525 RepID=A0AAD8C1S1_BIOPF|nr:TM2 domain-containing protein [Biomphalaria pfeifferi]
MDVFYSFLCLCQKNKLFLIGTFLSHILVSLAENDNQGERTGSFKKCSELLLGQYLCSNPEIDLDTQQPLGCSKEKQYVNAWCKTAPDVVCEGQFNNGTFLKPVPCKWTNGHSFETALLLSVFLGMFGVDRFYLGYPAIGLLKFSTLGFMFLGQLIDILLIATQVLNPSDGSAYVLDYYGAATVRLSRDNDTYLLLED